VNLQEFVTETLTQIVGGVKSAQAAVGELGAIVNPTRISGDTSKRLRSSTYGRLIQEIEFDVAVTTVESEKSERGGEIRVWSIGVGGKGERDATQTIANRIQFVVPIVLPGMPDQQPDEDHPKPI